jgi:hypothetical protein
MTNDKSFISDYNSITRDELQANDNIPVIHDLNLLNSNQSK